MIAITTAVASSSSGSFQQLVTACAIAIAVVRRGGAVGLFERGHDAVGAERAAGV